MTNIAYRAFCF